MNNYYLEIFVDMNNKKDNTTESNYGRANKEGRYSLVGINKNDKDSCINNNVSF